MITKMSLHVPKKYICLYKTYVTEVFKLFMEAAMHLRYRNPFVFHHLTIKCNYL